MTTKTRYIGFCPVCEGYFKCQPERGKQLLVHHGYKRPGIGNIVGDCFGVHREPHEVSPKLAIDYRNELVEYLDSLRSSYADLPRLTSLTFTNWRTNQVEKVTPGEPHWHRHFEEYKHSLEYRIREAERDIQRMQKHIDTWERLPLKTVEEEVEQVARQKRERAEQLSVERAAKRAELIERTQGRIDSAVRNQNMSSLANIYESLLQNYPEKLKLNKQQVLEVIDRPHVWSAFGLLRGDEYLIPRWREPTEANAILEKMKWPRPGAEIAWPPELGEPKKRKPRR